MTALGPERPFSPGTRNGCFARYKRTLEESITLWDVGDIVKLIEEWGVTQISSGLLHISAADMPTTLS